ncbi:MAG: hypothetical protein C5S48_10405 [Candidatus Methanogaster sp.]|nr:MAG: hypothetical protein C5S48_10405 [ANME-2 cluster archaeon]
MPVPINKTIMNRPQMISLAVVSIWCVTNIYVSFIALYLKIENHRMPELPGKAEDLIPWT